MKSMIYKCSTSLISVVLLSLCGLTKQGKPESPYNVIATNVTYISADVRWTSGSDMGSHEDFQILRYVGRGSTYVTISPKLSRRYNGTGSGQNWTHHLAGLESGSVYRVAVLAQNIDGQTFSVPTVFRTSSWPHRTNKRSYAAIIIACLVAVGVCLSLVGFVVYIVCKKRKSKDVTSKSSLVQEEH